MQEKKNKFGIKVGDVFVGSYGYDATFYEFYQVVEVMGSVKIKVKEIGRTSGNGAGAGPCCWTVRPLKDSFIDDAEYIRTVKNYNADQSKEGALIKGKWSYTTASYVENPFDIDWEEDDYH